VKPLGDVRVIVEKESLSGRLASCCVLAVADGDSQSIQMHQAYKDVMFKMANPPIHLGHVLALRLVAVHCCQGHSVPVPEARHR
jgi:hypothetical protein